MCLCSLQVLVSPEEPGGISPQQYALSGQSPAPAIPLHRHLRPPRHAGVWWQVQLQPDRDKAAPQL